MNTNSVQQPPPQQHDADSSAWAVTGISGVLTCGAVRYAKLYRGRGRQAEKLRISHSREGQHKYRAFFVSIILEKQFNGAVVIIHNEITQRQPEAYPRVTP
jgi:hypothetical protein